MQIETIREVVRGVTIEDASQFDDQGNVFVDAYREAVEDVMAALEKAALADEQMFTEDGMCTVLGGK